MKICKIFFNETKVFNLKVFPLFGDYTFSIFGIKYNRFYEVMVRVDSTVVGGPNVLTGQ